MLLTMTPKRCCSLLLAALCIRVGSGQRWRNNNRRSRSCPALTGCYLTKDLNSSNRNYLNDRSTSSVAPGMYHLVCDVAGSLSILQFQSTKRSSFHQYFAPYEYQNIDMECGETVRVMVNGWRGRRQCFRKMFTFAVDACSSAAAQCANYRCPNNSRAIGGRSCIDSFADCRCTNGFEKHRSNDVCVRSCTGNYQCPANSDREAGLACYESFDDCQCRPGFRRNEQTQSCERDCPDYQCPANARPRRNNRNGGCVSSFFDCRCNRGFLSDRNTETCAPICYSNYQCPRDSIAKPGVSCLQNFDDCLCKDRFEKNAARNACVPTCPNYECPRDATPKSGVSCVRSFADCRCKVGFEKDATSKKCIPSCPNYECPIYSKGIYGLSCIESFDDCECDRGFIKDPYLPTCKMAVTSPRDVTPAPRAPPTPAPIPIASGQIIPTKCEVDELIELMEQAVRTNKALAPQWLRLSFHDAGTFDQRRQVGGANGCLLTDERMRLEKENDSLDLALEPLKLIQDTWQGRASSADLIQFAGFFAVIRQRGTPGLTDSKRMELTEIFEWGRPDEKDCQTSWTLSLPGFDLGTEPTNIPLRCRMAGKEIKDKMMDRNGFTAFEATALLGGHTIGLTRNVFTERLAGPWAANGHDEATKDGPVFDNGFHSFLINDLAAKSAEEFVEKPDPFTTTFPTWFRFDDGDINHLDTDIVLAFPAQDTSIHPDYHAFTTRFANDGAFFIESFMKAFQKMSRLGVRQRLFPSAPCVNKAVSAFSSPDRAVAVPYQLELQSAVAEANVRLQETAIANKDEIEYLTTPVV